MPRCTLPAAASAKGNVTSAGLSVLRVKFFGSHRMLLRTGDGHAAECGFNTFGKTERQRLWGS